MNNAMQIESAPVFRERIKSGTKAYRPSPTVLVRMEEVQPETRLTNVHAVK